MRTRHTLYCSCVWSVGRGDGDVTDPVAFSYILPCLHLSGSSFFYVSSVWKFLYKLQEK